MLRIGSGSDAVGLGDILLLTAICRQTKCIVQLPPKAGRLASLFDRLAPVEITERPVHTPDVGEDHWARCKLRGLGLQPNDYLPRIVVPEVFPVAGIWSSFIWSNTVSPKWKHLRQIPPHMERTILDGLPGRQDDGGPAIPIRNKALVFRRCPRYIGADTGDMHLMLAVGGKCIVLIPDDCQDYQYRRWHYVDYPDRILYVNFRDASRVTADLMRKFFGGKS